MLHAPSACQAVTCTQRADAITSACLSRSGLSESRVLFDLGLFLLALQSVAGVEGGSARRSGRIPGLRARI